MRRFFAPLAFLCLQLGQAQITIGPGDMPSVGDTMRFYTAIATDIDLVQTGADQVWDNSGLVPQLPDADTAIAVSATPLLYQFFFNNVILYPEYVASYAMKGTDIGFQGVDIQDVYDYYKTSSTGFRNVGFGASVNGLPASVRRIPVDWVHRFPMDYSDQDTSFSSFEVTIPTLGFFGQSQWRYNHVDGWGTLVLPSATFDVLRVRSVLDRRDTVYVDQFNFGFGLDEPQTVEYKWIAAGMDRPVLVVTTVGGIATTAEYYHDPALGTAEVGAGQAQPFLYPNPAEDVVFLRIPNGMSGALRVTDATGREVQAPRRTNAAVERIALGALAPGSYIAQLQSAAGHWSMRFVVQ